MKVIKFFKHHWNKIVSGVCAGIIALLTVLQFAFVLAFAVAISPSKLIGFVTDDDYVDFITNFIQSHSGMTQEEWITTYFEDYYKYISEDYWNLATGAGGMYDSDNNFSDSYLEATEQQLAMFFAGNGIPFDWTDFVVYAKARRLAELNSSSFSSEDYLKKTDVSPVKISSEGFKTVIQEIEKFYSPSGDLGRLSWKYDERWTDMENKTFELWGRTLTYANDRYGRITLSTNYKFLNKWNCVYLNPYYFDGTDYYYSNFVYYLYYDGDVLGDAALCLKIYNTSTGTISDPITILACASKPCIDISINPTNIYGDFVLYYATDLLTFSDRNYIIGSNGENYGYSAYSTSDLGVTVSNGSVTGFGFYKSSDVTQVAVLNRSYGSGIEGNFNGTLTTSTTADYGFVCSDAYFAPEIGGYTDIDPDKIPDNTTVTITGDTIGDYIYTDNTTGDTTTINNYINNNYNYPDSGSTSDVPDLPDVPDPGDGDDSGGGSGGTVSGNVTVGGTVKVDGDITIKTYPIDINVNVNTSGSSSSPSGSGGAGENIGDYIDPGTVDTDISGYLDKVPEVSKNFIDYLKDFFAWLPSDIYGLLILGLLAAIFCRISGR